MTPHALIAPARLAGAPLLRAQSDERLVDLVRAGNDAAFEAIVARYRRPLLRYCSGFMSETRAEDAVQTAFVSAFGSLRASRGEMNLRPWLYRIAHNTSLNALRDRSLAHEELPENLDGVERPDQAFEKNERLRDVVGALGALPDRQRSAMVLRELEGRSYEEIAAELGVTDGSVRQLLNRARNTLRAGMTAVTPFGLLARVPWGAGPGEGVATRVAEMCAGGAGAAAVSKACATVLVAGAVIGGVAGSPDGGIEDGRAKSDGSATSRQVARSDSPKPTSNLSGPADSSDLGRDRSGSGRSDDSSPAVGPDAGRRRVREDGRANGDGRDDDRGGRGAGDGPHEDDGRERQGREDEAGEDRRDRGEGDEDHSGPGDGDTSYRDGGGSSGSGYGGGVDDPPEDPALDAVDLNSFGSGQSGGDSGESSGSSGSGSSGSGSRGGETDYPQSLDD